MTYICSPTGKAYFQRVEEVNLTSYVLSLLESEFDLTKGDN